MLLEFAASPEVDSLNEFNGHYFQLLVSKLLYKNDYARRRSVFIKKRSAKVKDAFGKTKMFQVFLRELVV